MMSPQMTLAMMMPMLRPDSPLEPPPLLPSSPGLAPTSGASLPVNPAPVTPSTRLTPRPHEDEADTVAEADAVSVAVTDADTPCVRLAVAGADADAVPDAVPELLGVSEAVLDAVGEALAPAAPGVAAGVLEADAEDPREADLLGVRLPVRERVGVLAAVGVRAAEAVGSGVGVLHAATGTVAAFTSRVIV